MSLIPIDQIYDKERFEDMIMYGHLIDIERPNDYAYPNNSTKSAAPSLSWWSGKRALITGAEGMVGSTIIDTLLTLGVEIHAIVRRHATQSRTNLCHNLGNVLFHLHETNLCDYSNISSIIEQVDPHAVFHQAAESFVPTSLNQPAYVVENNCVSTTNVLESCRRHAKSLEGIQLACSSEQYGYVRTPGELPIDETRDLRPTSTYAATKVFTENMGIAYHNMYGLPTIITRTFNQEGQRRGPQFFTSRIAQQTVQILSKKSDKLVCGNPNAVRDFTHIQDSSNAQILAIEKVNRGEPYNICSGRGITTGDYARLSLRLHNLETTPILIDTTLLRPYERQQALFDGFIGFNRKFVDKTGWSPTKSVADIIIDSTNFVAKQKEVSA